MSDVTRVYLITGFLGSGKTTLLNRIINRFPKDKKLTLLVNEFGEVGVDGTLVEGEDIDMMEISKGSIFCVCVKTDFIKGLYELNSKVQPDVMLIESTGVANPSDLKKDLKLPIFNDRFHFVEQFCVIDAAHFLDAYGVYASIEKQIATSTVFIMNKIDTASPETIEETKNVIRQFHPEPFFYDTTYADIPLADFFDLAELDLPDSEVPEPKKAKGSVLSEEARLTNLLMTSWIARILKLRHRTRSCPLPIAGTETIWSRLAPWPRLYPLLWSGPRGLSKKKVKCICSIMSWAIGPLKKPMCPRIASKTKILLSLLDRLNRWKESKGHPKQVIGPAKVCFNPTHHPEKTAT
jgi:G3E family GTPase